MRLIMKLSLNILCTPMWLQMGCVECAPPPLHFLLLSIYISMLKEVKFRVALNLAWIGQLIICIIIYCIFILDVFFWGEVLILYVVIKALHTKDWTRDPLYNSSPQQWIGNDNIFKKHNILTKLNICMQLRRTQSPQTTNVLIRWKLHAFKIIGPWYAKCTLNDALLFSLDGSEIDLIYFIGLGFKLEYSQNVEHLDQYYSMIKTWILCVLNNLSQLSRDSTMKEILTWRDYKVMEELCNLWVGGRQWLVSEMGRISFKMEGLNSQFNK